MKTLPLVRFPVLFLLAAAAAFAVVAGAQAPAPAVGRTLTIAASSLSLTLAKVTLVPGPLTAQDELYTGSYQVRVTPIPLGSESGRISVRVTEEALRRLERGQTVSFAGEAISESGKRRQVDARATPAGPDAGQVRLRIMADGRKLVFETGYRFEGP